MKKAKYGWNHNAAYYPFVLKTLKKENCGRILDVGCGDGSLSRYLAENGMSVIGIDPYDAGLTGSGGADGLSSVTFSVCSFEDFQSEERFDALVFAASLHHMEMTAALKKAVGMLKENGVLVIVGLASPSTVPDYLCEGLRVIPAALSTRLHRAVTCEDKGVPVSFSFPPMADVRAAARVLLPGFSLRYGLYYRYLLTWKKR